jgi:hypothetical protein
LNRGRIVYRYREGQQTLAARPGGGRLVVRQHEERDRCVLAGDGDDDERVKDLVVTEHGRRGIGAAARVDQCARRVGEATGEDKQAAVTPMRTSSWGKTTTPTHPSAIPMSAASHLGAATQMNSSPKMPA